MKTDTAQTKVGPFTAIRELELVSAWWCIQDFQLQIRVAYPMALSKDKEKQATNKLRAEDSAI